MKLILGILLVAMVTVLLLVIFQILYIIKWTFLENYIYFSMFDIFLPIPPIKTVDASKCA